jgi:hypothetical protein
VSTPAHEHGWLADISWSLYSTNAREPPQVQGYQMETVKELGIGIPLYMGVLRHVWVFGPSVLHCIIRDTGAWIEVSTLIITFRPSKSHSTT